MSLQSVSFLHEVEKAITNVEMAKTAINNFNFMIIIIKFKLLVFQKYVKKQYHVSKNKTNECDANLN